MFYETKCLISAVICLIMTSLFVEISFYVKNVSKPNLLCKNQIDRQNVDSCRTKVFFCCESHEFSQESGEPVA